MCTVLYTYITLTIVRVAINLIVDPTSCRWYQNYCIDSITHYFNNVLSLKYLKFCIVNTTKIMHYITLLYVRYPVVLNWTNVQSKSSSTIPRAHLLGLTSRTDSRAGHWQSNLFIFLIEVAFSLTVYLLTNYVYNTIHQFLLKDLSHNHLTLNVLFCWRGNQCFESVPCECQ